MYTSFAALVFWEMPNYIAFSNRYTKVWLVSAASRVTDLLFFFYINGLAKNAQESFFILLIVIKNITNFSKKN